MKHDKEHTNQGAFEEQSKTFFSGGKFNWGKSNAELWAQMEKKIDKIPEGRSLKVKFRSIAWVAAASILLLIGIGSFLRFYTIEINTQAGQHQMAELPDGSTVNLNAESTLKYQPYWWNFKRNIQFEGEGFFEVEKGKKFEVKSIKGTTEVLGTSFNVFSRNYIYKVTCLTGSVKVTSKQKEQVVLIPNSKAIILSNGEIEVQKDIVTFPEISWRNNIFLFTAAPVREVFYEIERQYNITINADFDDFTLYTGNFTKDQGVEEVLGYVCPALGLKYKRNSQGEYLIIKDNE